MKKTKVTGGRLRSHEVIRSQKRSLRLLILLVVWALDCINFEIERLKKEKLLWESQEKLNIQLIKDNNLKDERIAQLESDFTLMCRAIVNDNDLEDA